MEERRTSQSRWCVIMQRGETMHTRPSLHSKCPHAGYIMSLSADYTCAPQARQALLILDALARRTQSV